MGVQFAGNILVQSNGGPLPISSGGTGQTTAPTAINALLPVQTGQSGKILVTNGTNVSWSSVTMTPGGADTNIQFNDSGSFGGNSKFVINKTTGALTSTSTFSGIGLTISDSDALTRTLRYQTLGSDRWLMMANNTAETGAASGSDFALVRVADNGATSNIVYEISRATGVFDFKVAPTINGSPISSSIAASALTGTTLASNVVTSSLTSVGTLADLTVTNPIAGSVTGSAATVSAAAQPNITSVGTLSGLTVTATITGSISGAAARATNIIGGAAGNLVYQTAGTATGFIANGTSGQILTSNGASAPSWTAAPSSAASALTGTTLASNVVTSSLTTLGTLTNLSVTNPIAGSVTGSAATATNLAGGGVGYVPYQSASGTTAFLNAGTSGYVLMSNGTGIAPTWDNAQNLIAYPANEIVYGTGTGSASYSTLTYNPSTNLLTIGGAGLALIEAGTSQSLKLLSDTSIIMATGSTNWVVLNTNGSIAVNGATGTTGQVLASGGSGAPAGWTSSPTLSGTNITGIPTSAITGGTTTIGSTSIALGATSTTLAGLSSVTSTSFVGALTGHASSDVALSGGTMSGLLILSGDPTNALGAVTKQYADAIAAGVNVHAACETATAAPLAACTYDNVASGVGATLTANANGGLGTIGGYSPVGGWVSTSRILVKDQAAGLQNGIYTVTQAGSGSLPWILTRATDFDGSPTSEVGPGDLTYVQEGSLAGTQWVETAIGTGSPGDYIVIGTDAMVFGQFSGASSYTAGTGINIASNVISNTGVTSAVAGTNISVSGATGAVTIAVTGTVPSATSATTATNIAGGAAGSIAYQTGSGATSMLATATGVLVGGTTPSYSTAPTLTGTNFSGTAASLTAGTATTATNIAGGAAGSIAYQTGSGATTMLAAGTDGYVLTLASGVPTWAAGGGGGGAAGTLTGTTLASNVVNSSLTSVGTLSSLAVTGAITFNGGAAVGYLNVPQNVSGSGYTLVLADSGKHIFTSAGGQTWAIPANASVAFAIGTAVTFVNQSASPCTVTINSDTLYLAGAGTTGTRTIGTYGIATAMKTSATTWIISGTAVT